MCGDVELSHIPLRVAPSRQTHTNMSGKEVLYEAIAAVRRLCLSYPLLLACEPRTRGVFCWNILFPKSEVAGGDSLLRSWVGSEHTRHTVHLGVCVRGNRAAGCVRCTRQFPSPKFRSRCVFSLCCRDM